jgi:hypothetical protein
VENFRGSRGELLGYGVRHWTIVSSIWSCKATVDVVVETVEIDSPLTMILS